MADADTSPGKGRGDGVSAADIAAELRKVIVEQDLGPGQRVGVERELAETYGVTRWVIRKGLELLERDGLILRTHGRKGGVFVAPKRVVRDLEPLVGLPEYVRKQGLEAGTMVLGTSLGRPDPDIANDLQLNDGEWAYQLQRVRLTGGIPLCLEFNHLPADLFPGLFDFPVNTSIYGLLEEQYGIRRGAAEETISVDAATREQALILQVATGTPVLIVDRTAKLEDGVVFERSREIYRGDRISILVHTGGDYRRHQVLLSDVD